MRTIESPMTSQGQITIPPEVRRHLGLANRDRVTFVIDEAEVHLMAEQHTIESVRGSIPGIPGMSPELDKEIEEAIEDEMDRRLGRSR